MVMNGLEHAVQDNWIRLAWLIPLFPLIGVVINGFFGKKLPKTVTGPLACVTVFASFLLSVACVIQLAGLESGTYLYNASNFISVEPGAVKRIIVDVFPWIQAGSLNVMFGVMLDPLSSVMILVVSGVSFLIHVYSLGYMAKDEGYTRFFTYLNLFVFSPLLCGCLVQC